MIDDGALFGPFQEDVTLGATAEEVDPVAEPEEVDHLGQLVPGTLRSDQAAPNDPVALKQFLVPGEKDPFVTAGFFSDPGVVPTRVQETVEPRQPEKAAEAGHISVGHEADLFEGFREQDRGDGHVNGWSMGVDFHYLPPGRDVRERPFQVLRSYAAHLGMGYSLGFDEVLDRGRPGEIACRFG